MRLKMFQGMIVLFLIFFLIIAQGSANISQTSTLIPIENALQQVDEHTLVIFDIDDVLMMAQDQILQPAYKKDLETFTKALEEKYTEAKLQILWSIIFKSRRIQWIDPHLKEIFDSLKQKGVRTLLLTNAWTGTFGKIASLEDWRVQEVRDLGIDVSQSFDIKDPLIFRHLKSKDPARFPVFKQGCLFTCNIAKGTVLKAFLQYTRWTPHRIIFIDDKLKHLESVENFCKQGGIVFTGFHYTAVDEMPKAPLNQQIANYQFKVLEQKNKWLSDREASSLINIKVK